MITRYKNFIHHVLKVLRSFFISDDKKNKPIIFGIDIAKIIESEKFITLPKFIEVPKTVKDKKIILNKYLLKLLIPKI
jgi:hypothetical protein